MEFYNSILIWVLVFFFCNFNGSNSSKLIFREYIGAESDSIKLSDVPINNNVEFHFILSFAIDYTNNQTNPSPTNGKFNIFWPTKNLGPTQIASFKKSHPNVKIAVSLGGDSVVSDQNAVFFAPVTIESWVQNAVSSLTSIIKEYNIDGIDIDYEHFQSDPDTFAECIGQVINKLKQNRTISFASIAPYEDTQSHYLALWRKYGNFFDYVDFQFYAFDKLSRHQFIKDFEEQGRNYRGGKLLASFESGGGGGLGPGNGFFDACIELKEKGKLGGIFIWCAEESVGHGFQYEKTAQAILSS